MRPLPASKALLRIGILVILVLFGQEGVNLWLDHRDEEQRARIATGNTARTLADSVQNAFMSVSVVLQGTASSHVLLRTLEGKAHDDRVLGDMLKVATAGLPHMRALLLVSPDGALLVDSERSPPKPLNLGDRDYILAHMGSGHDIGTFFGRPVRGRDTGRWLAGVSRAVRDEAGTVKGVLVAVVEPEYFARSFHILDFPAGGRIRLLYEDGRLIAQDPPDPAALGQIVGMQPSQMTRGGLAELSDAGEDGADRLVQVFRRVDGLPFVVSVSLPERDMLAAWRRRAVWLAVSGVAGAGVIGWLIAVSIRQARRREAAEVDLAAARETAERASTAKSQFLATMSHEMRTPLHGVIGFADLLLADSLTPRQQEWVEFQREAGHILLTLVDDVLDIARIEADKLVINPRPFDLHGLLDACAALTGQTAGRKGLTSRMDIATGVPRVCLGDNGRIRQVLLNLMTNAVKFTDTGSVTVSVTVAHHQDGRERVRFEVADTGPGIAPAVLPRLFQLFEQGDGSTTRRHGGVGLGLAISRRLVELMDGTIGVDSQPGHGSRFWFVLPLPPADPATLPATRSAIFPPALPAVEAPPAGTARILVVEDIVMNRMLVSAILTRAGYTVDEAEHGVAAVAAAGQTAYDLILMDVQMPVMDGLAATRVIRQSRNGTGLPILGLSAAALPQELERCREAGMDGHVTKPVDGRILLEEIARLLARRAAAAPSPPAPAPSPDLPPGELILDTVQLASLTNTLGESETEAFIRTSLDEIALRAGRISPASPSADIVPDSHALVSLAGNLGLTALTDVCRRLTAACRTTPDADMTALVQDMHLAVAQGAAQIARQRAAKVRSGA
jgi:signal transduction histidine kinase/CheY-like chemotaxis protein/HPt (histidine-containing phosphotransfer) domain-containing protein